MNDERLETIPVREVAKALGIGAMKVKTAIKNHTLPIGCVCASDNGSSVERTVILRSRWEKWKAGEL